MRAAPRVRRPARGVGECGCGDGARGPVLREGQRLCVVLGLDAHDLGPAQEGYAVMLERGPDHGRGFRFFQGEGPFSHPQECDAAAEAGEGLGELTPDGAGTENQESIR